MQGKESTRLSRLFVPLVCGLFLTIGLLLAFSLRGPAEAKVDDPVVAVAPAQRSIRARLAAYEVPSVGAGRSTALQRSPVGPRPDPPGEARRPAFLDAASPGAVGAGSMAAGPSLGPRQHLPPEGAVFAADVAGRKGYVVDLAYDAVWGYVDPGDVVTVTRSDDAYGVDEADGVGFFWTPIWRFDGRPANVAGGDTLDVYVNGALGATLNPLTITGQIDVLNDRVVGTVSGAGAGEVVTVTLGTWAFQGSFLGAPQTTATTDASGAFTAAFDNNDLGPHQYVGVALGSGSSAQHSYLYPRGVFHVDTYGIAVGYAEPGQVVTATIVRGGVGLISATSTADWPHGGYGPMLKIVPGDVVEVDLGSDTVISVTAYTLTARIDVEADHVTGICPPLELSLIHI